MMYYKLFQKKTESEIEKNMLYNKVLDCARNKKKIEEYNRMAIQSGCSEPTYTAIKSDYEKWLLGYLGNNGEITNVYDYKIDCMNGWRIVRNDFKLFPLYGSSSKNFIAINGAKCVGGDRGHSNVYYTHDYTHDGCCVPIYSDTVFGDVNND